MNDKDQAAMEAWWVEDTRTHGWAAFNTSVSRMTWEAACAYKDKSDDRLREMVQQKLSSEMTDEEYNDADWIGGYDALVEMARKILNESEVSDE